MGNQVDNSLGKKRFITIGHVVVLLAYFVILIFLVHNNHKCSLERLIYRSLLHKYYKLPFYNEIRDKHIIIFNSMLRPLEISDISDGWIIENGSIIGAGRTMFDKERLEIYDELVRLNIQNLAAFACYETINKEPAVGMSVLEAIKRNGFGYVAVDSVAFSEYDINYGKSLITIDQLYDRIKNYNAKSDVVPKIVKELADQHTSEMRSNNKELVTKGDMANYIQGMANVACHEIVNQDPALGVKILETLVENGFGDIAVYGIEFPEDDTERGQSSITVKELYDRIKEHSTDSDAVQEIVKKFVDRHVWEKIDDKELEKEQTK